MKKFNIAIIHYIANFTDGVSLEMNKWKRVLEEMGHTVYLCAGQFGSAEEIVIEEMYHHSPEARLLNTNTFRALQDYRNEAVYRAELYRLAGIIEEKLSIFIEEKNVNFLIPQNVWSVGANPAVAIAVANVVNKYQIPALAHNHDFYFERMGGFALTSGTAAELADKYLPPRHPLARHVVINSLGKRQLLERKGISSTVVPNIFDFESSPWVVDDYNRYFRQRIGLRDNDIFMLQATRIVTRKGIELAIDLIKALGSPTRRARLKADGLYNGQAFSDDSRIVLVLAGYVLDDVTGRYASLLAHKADEAGIEALFIEDLIGERRTTRGGEKIYSLWDTYVHADFVTYPSLWEGWGNQLLEAVRAKLPIVLFEYPVFEADIKEKGLKVVSLGNEITGRDQRGLATIDQDIIEAAADQAVVLLTDDNQRREIVGHNYRIGKKHFSMEALYLHLEQLMQQFINP
jgi:glycosyltransferase involved in cell wall biosynthesis